MASGLAGLVLLAACGEDERVLSGERESLRAGTEAAEAPRPAPETAPPLSLPATRANAEWTQSIATPGTRTAHPALGPDPRLIWSADIGAGDGKRTRITADPVVAGGRIFTLDAQAGVTAVSTEGDVVWTRDLVPAGESGSDATGGGLAHGDGTVFVSSGFGVLTALDAATGEELWRQDLDTVATGSPTVHDGLVYVVSGDEVGWAIDADNGRIRWQLSGTPNKNNVLGAPAPALSSRYAVFAFGSGEVQTAFRKGGLRRWGSQVAGRRTGFSTAQVLDITSDPVIDADSIYVGTHAGRTVALELGSGDRRWTAPDGPLNPVWPAGGSLFLVSDRNELLRLSARDGGRLWSHKLPFFTKDKPKRQDEIYAHYGPVIAGGRLIVASNDGKIRYFDPETGTPRGTTPVPGGATTNPVVAGRTLYLVSTDGRLLAFR
jgi:outer membrane protein assembly factor BamB